MKTLLFHRLVVVAAACSRLGEVGSMVDRARPFTKGLVAALALTFTEISPPLCIGNIQTSKYKGIMSRVELTSINLLCLVHMLCIYQSLGLLFR